MYESVTCQLLAVTVESSHTNSSEENQSVRIMYKILYRFLLRDIKTYLLNSRSCRLSATSKAIEKLKASVSKLRLPKDHTPRI